jgi:hypothetical protein
MTWDYRKIEAFAAEKTGEATEGTAEGPAVLGREPINGG